ncbi:hypothetical protein [Variovorax paradoxus]|uniref:hypothetical protein n=1 Tax=Variovorax paradoxus TaxID=34073 RepID=UPI001933FFC8|nr:hypothetical protein INQ48_18160 [Variovorax paradoxus]
MSSFEDQVKAAAEKAVLQFVGSGGWLLPNYESRLKIPAEWIADCWRLVDAEALKRQIAARLEAELADRMVNHMAAELATDIKQILGVKERREMLRGLAREHMDAVMTAGKTTGRSA